MANNYVYQQPDGSTKTFKATDNGGVITPAHTIDALPADPLGANADAAVVTDAAGSVSGKLRGLVKWAYERMPASLGIKAASAAFPVQLSSDNPLPTKVSTDNSTTAVLGDSAVFTGSSEDVSKFRSVVVNVYASHAGTLALEYSSNGTNWDIARTYSVSAAAGIWVTHPVIAQYFRVVYTNGGTLQTSFRLQTILHPTLLPQARANQSYVNIDLGTTGQVVKASPGRLKRWYFATDSAEWRFVKFYNKATAPTEADTPVFTLFVPPAAAGNDSDVDGIEFSTGISVRATAGIANDDATAPGANEVMLSLTYSD